MKISRAHKCIHNKFLIKRAANWRSCPRNFHCLRLRGLERLLIFVDFSIIPQFARSFEALFFIKPTLFCVFMKIRQLTCWSDLSESSAQFHGSPIPAGTPFGRNYAKVHQPKPRKPSKWAPKRTRCQLHDNKSWAWFSSVKRNWNAHHSTLALWRSIIFSKFAYARGLEAS